MSHSRFFSWAGSALLILASIGVALVASELIVRNFIDSPILPRFVVDTGYGVRGNQANVETRHYMPGEYTVDVSTNSAGMRGTREYSVEKPPDTRRIALIGDSFIFGFGANDEQVVSAVLEDMLNEQQGAGRRFEVLNFSVSGFGQAEQLVTYREKVQQYEPDDVVLFYFNNDITNNAVADLFELDAGGDLRRTDKEYLPGVRAREILYGNPVTLWLFTHSQAWNLLRNRLSAIVQRSLIRDRGLEESSGVSEEAVRLTRALLKKFIAEIRADGANPVVFVIPHRTMESNFPFTAQKMRELDVPFIDGREIYTEELYYPKDSHWRPDGHALAAELLADLFAGNGLR